jgi:hypothetical protein
MTQQKTPESRSWHREPWPWIIIGLLGTTIIASIVTLWIAMTNPDFLVVDDSEYQQIKSELRAQPAVEEEAREQSGQDDG